MKTLLPALILSVIFTFSTAAYAQNSLVDKKCSVCHTTDRVYKMRGDQKKWDTIIERMKSNGLQISKDEEAKIKSYLYTLK